MLSLDERDRQLEVLTAWLVFLAFHMNSKRSAGINELLLTDTEHAALVAQTSQAIPSQADHIRVRGWLV